MFNPSEQQGLIFDFTAHDTRSFCVIARAGTGKTTTIEHLIPHIPDVKSKSVVVLAFNKNAAMNFAGRLPSYIQSKTFHSHCLSVLTPALPRRPRVNENKVFDLIREHMSKDDYYLYGKFVQKLVSHGKNAGVGVLVPNEQDAWYSLIEHYAMFIGVEDTDEEIAVNFARQILDASNEELGIIDFDDMLYLTLKLRVNFNKWNYVLLDEAQDTNGVQRIILQKMLAPAPLGRLIAVGDPAQSIYGFRGASADAMEEIIDDFDCVTLPLSVSYRCAQEPIAEAQKYVPQIEAHPTAAVGSVKTVDSYDISDFTSSDVILCRVTAPLVTMAFGFIKRNVGVRILGREIGQGLVSLVKRMGTDDIETFSEKLSRYTEREYSKALNRGHESAAAAIEDRTACINVFVEQLSESDRTVRALIARIESLFVNDVRGMLTLCSVHKAKGLEWDNVFILDSDKYMPSKWATKPWQQTQEINLIYVAITRTKLNLRYIKSDGWRKPLAPKVDSAEQKRKELLESL